MIKLDYLKLDKYSIRNECANLLLEIYIYGVILDDDKIVFIPM